VFCVVVFLVGGSKKTPHEDLVLIVAVTVKIGCGFGCGSSGCRGGRAFDSL